MSTIFCRYCNKLEHIEGECRKKQYNQKGKGRRFFPQANNTWLQSNNKDYEDEENNFIQAFMCEMELAQTKDESRSNEIEACYLKTNHLIKLLVWILYMWFGYKPNFSHLRIFDVMAYDHILQEKKGK